MDCKNEISRTQYTHDIAWHCCAILIVMISAKESILNVHFEIVQEVLKNKGNSSLHYVLYNMIQNVGNSYTRLSLGRCLTYATNVVISIATVFGGMITFVYFTHWSNTDYIQIGNCVRFFKFKKTLRTWNTYFSSKMYSECSF